MGPGGIELATPGSAVRHVSAARHVTSSATQPGTSKYGTIVSTIIEVLLLTVVKVTHLMCILIYGPCH